MTFDGQQVLLVIMQSTLVAPPHTTCKRNKGIGKLSWSAPASLFVGWTHLFSVLLLQRFSMVLSVLHLQRFSMSIKITASDLSLQKQFSKGSCIATSLHTRFFEGSFISQAAGLLNSMAVQVKFWVGRLNFGFWFLFSLALLPVSLRQPCLFVSFCFMDLLRQVCYVGSPVTVKDDHSSSVYWHNSSHMHLPMTCHWLSSLPPKNMTENTSLEKMMGENQPDSNIQPFLSSWYSLKCWERLTASETTDVWNGVLSIKSFLIHHCRNEKTVLRIIAISSLHTRLYKSISIRKNISEKQDFHFHVYY